MCCPEMRYHIWCSKNNIHFSVVLLTIYVVSLWCYPSKYNIWCCQRFRYFDLGAVNEVQDICFGAITEFT